ncbi:lytic transglycosylase domain-containing protein [Frankia sp. R43]|uniref:lytic transglycosylase domain-containing protein n=1 Tax=Frankia sp. R43 TaxID=269536 RepID=UPI0006CA5642|nr:lytic transglycosylase domain-containing protein [Frankia sp. R43]
MPTPTPDGGDGTSPPVAPSVQDLAVAAASPATITSTVTLTAADQGIPARLLAAYQQTANQLTETEPHCHLPWQLLAAIGKVESGHAAGRPISSDGTITRPILGPPLNGTAGVALIHDTDHGALDHDTTYDRAVGPMQFIPTTWAASGRDGNNDGLKNPHNIHDATLAAAYFLCAHGRDLTDPTQLRAAILAYNPSNAYLRTVLTWMNGYQHTNPTALPDTPTSWTPPTPTRPPPHPHTHRPQNRRLPPIPTRPRQPHPPP